MATFVFDGWDPHLPGGRGEGRDGESQAGQQEDSLQPSARTRGPTLPHVEPQEHGEHA